MSNQPIELREKVRARYRDSALTGSGCSDPRAAGECCSPSANDMTGGQYSTHDLADLPDGAASASLGCGNPAAVADLRPGEVVLDLGSGGGIDVILSARRVGPTGFVYGIDMTEEMLALARRNATEAGVDNVEFRHGLIEDVPLPDGSVDVVISNCVINLSVDKSAVAGEIHRVLRPGGRLGITDVVADDSLTSEERSERGSWVGCIAGALSRSEYRAELRRAGFAEIELTPTHAVAEGMQSMVIRAVKPR